MNRQAHSIIDVTHVYKSYDNGRIPVLRGVSLRVLPGEVVALWGASGSGKSTLLHLIGGLDVPDEGTLRVAGLDPRSERDRLELRRRHVGFVFQLHNLIPDLTAAENLAVPALAVNLSKAETQARVLELANLLGIGHRLGHRVQDLSGGERQRAAIGRAMMNSPRVLLADEPTGSLDERTGDAVFEMMKSLAKNAGIAVVLATHERRFAEACDRILRVREGVLCES